MEPASKAASNDRACPAGQASNGNKRKGGKKSCKAASSVTEHGQQAKQAANMEPKAWKGKPQSSEQ